MKLFEPLVLKDDITIGAGRKALRRSGIEAVISNLKRGFNRLVQ
jgi:hypothetical protein